MTGGEHAPAHLLPLLRELGDLKRVRSAAHEGSIAQRLFARAWAALLEGQGAEAVALSTTRRALAAARLGDLDATVLARAGLPAGAARGIEAAALAELAQHLPDALREGLEAAAPLTETRAGLNFVRALSRQPRAGATCPGKPRLMLEPPEDHAEHCLVTAVNAVVLSPSWGADIGTVFVAALAHHLHNALLPDSGFAGEMLLGPWLEPAMQAGTEAALAELPQGLRAAVVEARRILPDDSTPEGRAFHAADTLDRILQMEHHLRAAGTTMRFIQREMELVHEGPVRAFQEAVLTRMGLAA